MYYSYKSRYDYNRSNFEKSKQTDGFKGWRKAQYAAQSGRCAWCYEKVDYKDMDVDHIHPLSHSYFDDDVNDFDNLVLACHECNRDLKVGSTYNEVAYKKTLDKMTIQQKQDGYAPERIYWSRPEWIGANKYSKSYKDYSPVNVPVSERNVWEIEAPLIRDHSLKVDNLSYAKKIAGEKIEEESGKIWKIIKWAFIIGAVVFLINVFSNSESESSSKTTGGSGYCDESCQERGYQKYLEEEHKAEQKRRQEEWEDYQEYVRYDSCRAAGGSELDCM